MLVLRALQALKVMLVLRALQDHKEILDHRDLRVL
jgi:hypothetical protein